jgi:hypothetical protein
MSERYYLLHGIELTPEQSEAVRYAAGRGQYRHLTSEQMERFLREQLVDRIRRITRDYRKIVMNIPVECVVSLTPEERIAIAFMENEDAFLQNPVPATQSECKLFLLRQIDEFTRDMLADYYLEAMCVQQKIVDKQTVFSFTFDEHKPEPKKRERKKKVAAIKKREKKCQT